MEYELIDTDAKLIAYQNYIDENGVRMVAMDFEGEFNLHIYGEKLCLIQIFDGHKAFLVDPFNISTSVLKRMLENKNVIKIMYGTGGDRSLVYRQYDITLKSVLDLETLVEVIGLNEKSLNKVLESVLRIESPDKKRFQMYNWTLRPIKKDALVYALSDVLYLFELKDALFRIIREKGLEENLALAYARQDIVLSKTSTPGLYKRREYKELSSQQKKVFTSLFDLRDGYARALNVPPNTVFPNDSLFRLCADKNELTRVQWYKKLEPSMKEEIIRKVTEIVGD